MDYKIHGRQIQRKDLGMNHISILIVEDEAMTAMYMSTMLRRYGFEVYKCLSTGEDAVDFAVKNSPDLILMDIRLAGNMDGIEAAQKILSTTAHPVQIIFTTGYSDIEYRERAHKLNPAGFLVKPLNTKELIGIIESCFILDN